MKTSFSHTEILHQLMKLLQTKYVFPETAAEMVRMLKEKQANSTYETIHDPETFCRQLTNDLQDICRDKHLFIRYFPNQSNPQDQTEIEKNFMLKVQKQNYGFHEVKRLSGNIGYIDLRLFSDPKDAAEIAASSMNFVANTDALIVDVRKNHGGMPEMVAFLTSYFFDKPPFLLNTIYDRLEDKTEQYWTLSYVPGKRYTEKPIYILTSSKTFSAGEEFAYNLKHLKRATVIGEVTAGGANPGQTYSVADHFIAFIPYAFAKNPITKTNWEGKGVIPDIQTDSENAFKEAYQKALDDVINQYRDQKSFDFLLEEAETKRKEL
ncbi:MAG: S41 family peptidase [Bacillaceae bacterium]|nr:S41 family peptidase [Bacillaceae bacterium]